MKKHITVLLSIVLITIFLLASYVEIETDSGLHGNMASETNIINTGTISSIPNATTNTENPSTAIITDEIITDKPLASDTRSEAEKLSQITWKTNKDKNFVFPDIDSYNNDEYACIHYDWFNNDIHSVDCIFLDYFKVGNVDPLAKAMTKKYAETQDWGCGRGYTLYNLVRELGVSREEFEKLYYNSFLMYTWDINFDILYQDDYKLYSEYYNYKNNYERNFMLNSLSFRNEFWLKYDLAKYYIEKKGIEESLQKIFIEKGSRIYELPDLPNMGGGYLVNIIKFSLPELVKYLDISKEEFIEFIYNDRYKMSPVFSYDLDLIYSNDADMWKKIDSATCLVDICNIDKSLRLDG
ncbi:hypothetical protein SDC9_132071 [bioreactor metagenome]|uniref:Uncharacterized protein n=1 Tax=bioreactor metagenome TaxID=1076179 RepID=A0A645D6N1_9ZZZZ